MRGIIITVALLAAAGPGRALAQEYLQGSTPSVSACTGTYYDSGGPAGQHLDNEDSQITFCNPGVGVISLSFTSFELESCCDFLTFYDGTSTLDPMIGQFTGTTSPGVVSSTGTCLTAQFHSDGSVTRPGWSASLSCGTPSGENGSPCASPGACLSGWCVGGICCAEQCDDGLMCNGVETCGGGFCSPGTPPSCDDFDVCTFDECVEGIGCQSEPITPCEGGDAGPRPDGGTARDAGTSLRGRRGSRGCCAVAGTSDGDGAGWAVTLVMIGAAAARRRWKRRAAA